MWRERRLTEDYGWAGSRARGRATEGVPLGRVEEDSAGNWRRESFLFVFLGFLFVCFFSFRHLVAWFSYLSQYIFTYLLLK